MFPEGHPEEVETITTDLSCEFRSSERKIDGVSTQSMVSTTLTVKDAAGNEVVSFADCAGATVELTVGKYNFTYEAVVSGALAQNQSISTETAFSIASYQPLLVWTEDAPASLAGYTVNLSNADEMALGGDAFFFD